MEIFSTKQIQEVKDGMSVFNKVEVVHNISKQVYKFVKDRVRPQLRLILKPTKKEDALTKIYLRIHGNMYSITKLNGKIHFQGTIMITRSILELLLDLKLLIKDEEGDDIDKFLAFGEVERFRVAEKIETHFKTHPSDFRGDFTEMENYVTDQTRVTKVNGLKNKYFQGRYPNRNWANKNNEDKAKEVDEKYCLGNKYLDKYISAYSIMSWSIHSGSTYFDLTEDELLQQMLNSLGLSQEFYLDATDSIVKYLRLDKAIENYHKDFPDLEDLREEFFKKKAIKILIKRYKSKS